MSAIILESVYKHYQLYDNDYQRLKEIISGRSTAKVIKSLEPVSLDIKKSQVVGIIGNNGAGKSTLLKLISGTTAPSGGTIETNGRITALLELGTGFHPELSGHENIYLYGAILGISQAKMAELYDDIVQFSGVAQFIHQPVKTYSSGMFVRLAFSVATAVEPDILIIDEALSVGDGNFARKSFDRIMSFKEAGKTILFCSHAMFHIESICSRVIWIDSGSILMDGEPSEVVSAYNASMKKSNVTKISNKKADKKITEEKDKQEEIGTKKVSFLNKDVQNNLVSASFNSISTSINGKKDKKLIVQSGQSNISIKAVFTSELSIETPTFAITITDANYFNIVSACTLFDKQKIVRNQNGVSQVELTFPKIDLLQGKYYINVYLMCEKCIFVYEEAINIAKLEVVQNSLELGVVRLPHQWNIGG